jgi:hypothetical protein
MAGQRLFFGVFRPMAEGWPGSAGRGRRRQAGVVLRSGRALEQNFIFSRSSPARPGAGGEENGGGDSADIKKPESKRKA